MTLIKKNPNPIAHLKKYRGIKIMDVGQAEFHFFGPPEAEIFSRIINESLAGTLKENLVSTPKAMYPEGFVHASIRGRPWHGTFWTRDGGTYLRELVYWGAEHQMRLVANALIDLVGPNEDGLYTYPEYFKPGHPNYGYELDGTGSIIIALVMVANHLPTSDPLYIKIRDFLLGSKSPLHFLTQMLDKEILIAGSGEFGPGCGLKGKVFNVVQNGLVRLALLSGINLAQKVKDLNLVSKWQKYVTDLNAAMQSNLTAEDGGWYWCISPESKKPDISILNHEINDGFGGILGAFCMQSDVLGFHPDRSWLGLNQAQATFNRLWDFPTRQTKFNQYGIWTQFNRYLNGCHSGPSYGHGYALQSMLLMNKLEMTQAAIHGLVHFTYNQGQRRSPYYIFEQWRVPPVKNMARMGCGELNLVNVSETLKVARMLIGLDDRNPEEIKITPRLPPSWTGASVLKIPVRSTTGVIRADIIIQKGKEIEIAAILENGIPLQFSQIP